jgi:hypothetical protein
MFACLAFLLVLVPIFREVLCFVFHPLSNPLSHLILASKSKNLRTSTAFHSAMTAFIFKRIRAFELELELVKTQMTQERVLRAVGLASLV